MTELPLIERALAGGTPACLTCSFQAEDVVVLHLLRQVRPDIPVLFLDTGYHFADLLRYRDHLVETWGVNLVNVTSGLCRNLRRSRAISTSAWKRRAARRCRAQSMRSNSSWWM